MLVKVVAFTKTLQRVFVRPFPQLGSLVSILKNLFSPKFTNFRNKLECLFLQAFVA